MLKQERLDRIVSLVNEQGTITVSEMAHSIGVSEMTIRRDLTELNEKNKLIRVHGGAQSLDSSYNFEKNFSEKREIHVREKQEVATKAAKLAQDNETIYVGPGTTLEFMVAKLNQKHLRIITNSLPVFKMARDNPNNYEIILIGGPYRRTSGACIGTLAEAEIKSMSYDRAFIDVNGIINNSLMTANMEEGLTEKIALDQSRNKIIVTDKFKFDRTDFYKFYDLSSVDQVITNKNINPIIMKKYSQYARVDNT